MTLQRSKGSTSHQPPQQSREDCHDEEGETRSRQQHVPLNGALVIDGASDADAQLDPPRAHGDGDVDRGRAENGTERN